MRLFFLMILASGLIGCETGTAAGADATVSADTSGTDAITVDTSSDVAASDVSDSDVPASDVPTSDIPSVDAGDSGSSDVAVTPVAPKSGVVWVNEIYAGFDSSGSTTAPAAATDADWFELYNVGTAPIDLSNCRAGAVINGYGGATVVPSAIIPAGGFLVVYCNHFNLGVPVIDVGLKSGGSLGLWDAQGVLIDSVDWNQGASPNGASYDRLPDGGATWQTIAPTTPGKPNGK
jgi:hypothetical protein